MNTRNLAIQAISYLNSLDGNDIPDCKKWFDKREREYAALLKLNKAGLGATMGELQKMADEPLKDQYAKKVIAQLKKIDLRVSELDKRKDGIDKNPNMWKNFFSGLESVPTYKCKQALDSIESQTNKLASKMDELLKSITMEQAEKFGYPVIGLDESDFN